MHVQILLVMRVSLVSKYSTFLKTLEQGTRNYKVIHTFGLIFRFLQNLLILFEIVYISVNISKRCQTEYVYVCSTTLFVIYFCVSSSLTVGMYSFSQQDSQVNELAP